MFLLKTIQMKDEKLPLKCYIAFHNTRLKPNQWLKTLHELYLFVLIVRLVRLINLLLIEFSLNISTIIMHLIFIYVKKLKLWSLYYYTVIYNIHDTLNIFLHYSYVLCWSEEHLYKCSIDNLIICNLTVCYDLTSDILFSKIALNMKVQNVL